MKWKIQLRDAFIFAAADSAPGAPHSKKWTLFLLFAHFSLESDTFAAAASVDAESNHTFSINIKELGQVGKTRWKLGKSMKRGAHLKFVWTLGGGGGMCHTKVFAWYLPVSVWYKWRRRRRRGKRACCRQLIADESSLATNCPVTFGGGGGSENALVFVWWSAIMEKVVLLLLNSIA